MSKLWCGPVLCELQQQVAPGYGQTWLLYRSDSLEAQAVHITHEVGPLQRGRELVTRLSTDVDNVEEGQPIAYTDDNALEFVKRHTNLQQPEPIPSSYYPISAAAFIREESAAARQLTVLTDRAHGAASLAKGELEVMLHRRCDSNDNKGNGENLDETDHISASTMLLLDPRAEAMDKVRRLSLQQNFPPTAIFAPAESVASYKAHAATSSSRLLEKALPPNVHLLSLDQRYGSGNATVLRLQHVYEASDQSNLSAPVSVDLGEYLDLDVRLESMVEMSLSANLRKASVDSQRLRWRVENESTAVGRDDAGAAADGGPHVVTLRPREIRTFLLNAEPADPPA